MSCGRYGWASLLLLVGVGGTAAREARPGRWTTACHRPAAPAVPGRSLGGGPAVDRQGGAGDERSLVAERERHECRDLVRARHPAGGVRRRPVPPPVTTTTLDARRPVIGRTSRLARSRRSQRPASSP